VNTEKYNLLSIGSCRICTVLNKYQNTYNTSEKIRGRHLNQKCIIGRSWSINEQLDLLKLIKGDKPLIEYVGDDFPSIEQIKDNLLFLREKFNQIDAVVVEVSSLRYYQNTDNKLIHNIQHNKIKANAYIHKDMSPAEFEKKIKEFIKYSGKPIFFVSHFDRKSKPYREVIWEKIKKVSTEHENIFLIDTSLMPNIQTRDSEHYNKVGGDNAMKYIGSIISQTLHRILRR
jgi:hypothetical protein